MAAIPPSVSGSDNDADAPQSFTNNQGMRMIRVKGASFDAWTPSVARYQSMVSEHGGKPDVAFALNRPRVPIRVELNDFYLSEFLVTNKMYRQAGDQRRRRTIPDEPNVAIPALIDALKDADERVRWSAAGTIGNIGPSANAAVPNLIEALKDEDKFVRWSAASALGQIGPAAKAAIPNLIDALKAEDMALRWSAPYTLGRIATALQERKDTTAIPDLEKALAALQAMNTGSNERVQNVKAAETTHVRRAVEALKAIEKGR